MFIAGRPPLFAFALGAALAIGQGAEAQVQGGAGESAAAPVLVELFTSQGCSSCPPADALLAELAGRGDVLALALHVDYWDYIGWADTFGSPAYTERQKQYARAAGHRTIYTPQMVIGGADQVVGYKPMQVAELIEAHQARPPQARLALRRDGDVLAVRLVLDLPASAPEVARAGAGDTAAMATRSIAESQRMAGPGGYVVQLVRFERRASVMIERGENEGRRIDYANIVTDWQRVGEWDGVSDLALDLAVPGPEAVAVIVQRAGMGPVVASAELRP